MLQTEELQDLSSVPRGESLLEVEELAINFRARDHHWDQAFARKQKLLKAVDGISFSIRAGESFGLVGETGSGKSTIAKALVGLYRPSGGRIRLLGRQIDFDRKEDLHYLRQNVGIVFQDPVGSLNPRLSVRDIVAEALIAAGNVREEHFDPRISEAIERVGLRASSLSMYPRELSGGEKQRVSLARAIVVPKKLLILDEPTSSLDLTIQAQVLNTLKKLKAELELSFLFITHDINVIRYMSTRLAVLFYGKMVEVGFTHDLLTNPMHPYSKELLSNLPSLDRRPEVARIFAEHKAATSGCVYRDVCAAAFERCKEAEPALEAPAGENRYVACFLYFREKVASRILPKEV